MKDAQNVSNKGSLPSALNKEYAESLLSTNKEETDPNVDAEELMLRVLSALASQKDLARVRRKRRQDDIISSPDWLWKTLTSDSHSMDMTPMPSVESPQYEWWMGIRLIHDLLKQLTPFELHTIANQSIVFTEGSLTHGSLCLLLCAYALRQCHPGPIEKRWKRWQSLVCETIRLYQHYGLELVDLAVPLWNDHIVPACQHVIKGLPSEAHHIAFFASLVGTTSTLVMRECCRPEREEKVVAQCVLSHVLQLLEVVRKIDEDYGYSETWMWSHPWRLRSEQVEEKNAEVEYAGGRENITWWTQSAYRHESVAGMDTSWDDLGLSLLALVAFDSRPLVLSPTYIWIVWFPHVDTLFRTTASHPTLKHLPLSLLDNLLRISSERSLPHTKTSSKRPDSPHQTFQQLSNRLLEQQRIYIDGEERQESNKDSNEQLLETDLDTRKLVGLMKSLLTRYQPVNQVKIIRKLVHDCPHPALQAKFMDLLRSVIFEPCAADALWTYIGSFIKEMLEHVDSKQGRIIHVETLVAKVELYVGAVTMIQLWCLVKFRVPRKIKGQALGDFYKVLKATLEHWLTGTMTMPPDDYYRLYLLEGALQQVLHVLNEARKRKNDPIIESESQLPSTSNEYMAPATEVACSENSFSEPGKVIVGQADIFS